MLVEPCLFGLNMQCDRRSFLKVLGASIGSSILPFLSRPVFSSNRFTGTPLVGINAYYLLVECYRKVRENSDKLSKELIREYLYSDLGLESICTKTNLNSIRFWAFSDYQECLSVEQGSSFDSRLWLSYDSINDRVLETLEILIETLDDLELRLIPVLSNYWPSYGGILQYLVWTGNLDKNTFAKALCDKQAEQRIYLSYGMKFFTSKKVEECFRKHVSRVLDVLSKAKNLYIIDVMNEPRGKCYQSMKNEFYKGTEKCSDILARWLNRQAMWIKEKLLRYNGKECLLSSGEEGWTEQELSGNYRYLKTESQYYEGVDCLKNVSKYPGCLNCASVHMYPHALVALYRKNICGKIFRDQRGWDYLLEEGLSPSLEHYQKLAEEWIVSRSKLLKGKKWYIGEMGWSWPVSPGKPSPKSSVDLLEVRKNIYTRWHDLAIKNGALGTCVWMLNGVQHKDDFYGVTKDQLIEILRALKVNA